MLFNCANLMRCISIQGCFYCLCFMFNFVSSYDQRKMIGDNVNSIFTWKRCEKGVSILN